MRDDLTVNPIPERADAIRIQVAEEGGLCAIDIPIFTDTDDFLDSVVSSVSGSTQCTVNVCRSEGCHKCTENLGGNPTCVPCATSNECDAPEEEVIEYRYCDCDLVATVNVDNEFALYTGEDTINKL